MTTTDLRHKAVSRRVLLSACTYAPAMLLPYRSDAFVGPLMRILLRGVLGRSAARAAAAAAGRFISTRALASSFALVEFGAIVAISVEVAKLVEQYDARAIFVRGAENSVTIVGDRHFSGNLSYALTDVTRGQDCFVRSHYTSALGAFKFSFKISDLPFSGVGSLRAFFSDTPNDSVTSHNFVIAEPDQVSFGS